MWWAIVVVAVSSGGAFAQPVTPKPACPDWSTKFDRIDDPDLQAVLKAHKAQGWDAVVQQGADKGASVTTLVDAGGRRLTHLQAAAIKTLPAVTAAECKGLPAGSPKSAACDEHKRLNQSLAVDGMLDLLKCRAAAGPVAHHQPIATGKPVAQVALHIAAASPVRAVALPFLAVGPDKDKTTVEVPLGTYVLLRASPTVHATGFVISPAQGVMEAAEGTYHFPSGVFGIVKATHEGTVNITFIGGATASVNPGNPAGSTAPNWSGYALNGTFTGITGQWTVPTITASTVDSGDIDKPSYGRGAGVPPKGCGPGEQYDAGLCYPTCRATYNGVGPLCWGTCPAGYHDDGATCRVDVEITAKKSYGRGVGTPPTNCGPGRDYDAGLCYPQCNAGFSGVGPVCWQQCRPGYHDDGATCRKDVSIISANNNACPWYDKCGLVTARGCSTCPAGYHNDGCTCRIDADIYGKSSYGRGVGTVPNQCANGQQYDAGLCYTPCRAGYSGVGPVCWEACPAGLHDDGATCRKDAIIVGKPSYGRGVGTVPTGCGAGNALDAGLCYTACSPGYSGIGPVCWGSCPLGYLDQGAICYKPTTVESSTWVGIDGNGNSNLIQTGTAQNYDAGFLGIGVGPQYSVWWEIIPAPSTPINKPVSPGDVMFAQIAPAPGTTPQANVASNWIITLQNKTQNWTFTTTQSYSAPLSTAEWIQEATSECNPAGCAYMQLANYGSVTFSTFDKINANLNPGLVSSEAITMVQDGTAVSTPSNPDGDTDSFTCTFGGTVPPAPTP